MPYLPIAALVLVGLVLLGLSVVRLVRGLGQLRAAVGSTSAAFRDDAGLVKARVAAFQVAVAERKRRSGRVPSNSPSETGDRS